MAVKLAVKAKPSHAQLGDGIAGAVHLRCVGCTEHHPDSQRRAPQAVGVDAPKGACATVAAQVGRHGRTFSLGHSAGQVVQNGKGAQIQRHGLQYRSQSRHA